MVRECEVCGGIIRGAGKKYCSYCRNSREAKEQSYDGVYSNGTEPLPTNKSYGLFVVLILFILIGSIVVFNIAGNKADSELDNTTNLIVSSTNESCQYKELKETSEFIQVLYDKQGNRYENPVEIKNIAGGQGRISFDLVNKIPLSVSVKVNYEISHSGGTFWPNNEEFHDIKPLETITIVNTGTSGILYGTSSVGNIRITYLSNNDLEVKPEKKKEEICKLCNGEVCLNDGIECNIDVECGSGVCNIAGYCGSQKVIDCSEDLQNCNNQSCLEPKIKEKGQSYSCEFECKSGYGKDGICSTPLKEKVLKWFILIIFVVILILVIYLTLTGKNLFKFFRS
ncbi:hypothetical protein HYV49_02150 [Candidatus Pacearchaeota archaeon]|nr:hypothetical protein [Candidatus Pacearchaeota archaeon]